PGSVLGNVSGDLVIAATPTRAIQVRRQGKCPGECFKHFKLSGPCPPAPGWQRGCVEAVSARPSTRDPGWDQTGAQGGLFGFGQAAVQAVRHPLPKLFENRLLRLLVGALLKRRGGQTPPRVRIPPSPLAC